MKTTAYYIYGALLVFAIIAEAWNMFWMLIIIGIIALVIGMLPDGGDMKNWIKSHLGTEKKKEEGDIVIPQFVSFGIGIVFCLGLALIPTVIVWIAVAPITSWLALPVFLFSAVCSFMFFFHGQLQKIDVGYHAVIIFLGKPRFKYLVYGAGDYWKFPLTQLEPVNVSEQITNYPPNKEDPGFEVLALTEGKAVEGKEDEATGGKAAMWVRAAPRWSVVWSRKYIEFENEFKLFKDDFTKSKLFEELRNEIIGILRLIAAGLDDETFSRSKDVLAASALTGKTNELLNQVAAGIPDDNINGDNLIERSLNTIAFEDWGVKVKKLIISKAKPQNMDLLRKRESLTMEKYDRISESEERKHIQNSIKALALMYVRFGWDKKAASGEATRVILAQLDKVESYDFGPSGQGGGDFTKAAAIYSGVQQRQQEGRQREERQERGPRPQRQDREQRGPRQPRREPPQQTQQEPPEIT